MPNNDKRSRDLGGTVLPLPPSSEQTIGPLSAPPQQESPSRAVRKKTTTVASFARSSLFEEPGFVEALLPPEERLIVLKALAAEVSTCRKCSELARTRTRTVFADGSPDAKLMFIGEAPGAQEDRVGLPFVGPAGQLLTDMITKGMGLRREDVYIANILKCRPPENRDPTLEESSNCIDYLVRQIEVVRPQFLCLLGRVAVQSILETTLSMARMRGKWHRYRSIPTVVTYHPSFLLRSPAYKKEAWEDLQMLMKAMGLVVPRRKAD